MMVAMTWCVAHSFRDNKRPIILSRRIYTVAGDHPPGFQWLLARGPTRSKGNLNVTYARARLSETIRLHYIQLFFYTRIIVYNCYYRCSTMISR